MQDESMMKRKATRPINKPRQAAKLNVDTCDSSLLTSLDEDSDEENHPVEFYGLWAVGGLGASNTVNSRSFESSDDSDND